MINPILFEKKKVCGQARFYAVESKIHEVMARLLCKTRVRPRKAFNLVELLALQELGCIIAIRSDGKDIPLEAA